MKLKYLGVVLMACMLVLAACGEDNEEEEENNIEENEANENEAEEPEEEPENNENNEEETSTSDGDIMNPAFEEEGDGEVEVVYTNDNPEYVNDLDGLIVTVNQYQLVQVSDLKQSEEFKFNEDLEGYAVTADVTVDNTTDTDLFYNYTMQIRGDDKYDYVPSNGNNYVPEDKQMTYDDPDDRSFQSGEEENFFVTFVMTNDEFDELQSTEPKFVIEGNVAESDDFEGTYGEEEVFAFILSDEQGDEVAESDDFYQDKITTDNVAEKELVFEEEMNETQEIDNAAVTIEGVQYADLDIKDASKDRFESFDGDDLMTITVEVEVDNQSDEMIYNDGFSTTLIVNDGETRILSQGSLENDSGQTIEPGDTGTRQLVYLFAEKYYDIYEEFDLKMGPFSGEDGYLFKEKTLEFNLPRE